MALRYMLPFLVAATEFVVVYRWTVDVLTPLVR